MKLTLQQTNQLIRESIERFNSADNKMSLLSERKITIEKLLISEGFAVTAILNYQDDQNMNDGNLYDDAAVKMHREIPQSRKVFPPIDARDGWADSRLPSFYLNFDQNRQDGLVSFASPEMSGVDTDFAVYAAFTTAMPTDDTPPCVEMLLNAIKQKDESTPYRISDDTLAVYEQSAAERLVSFIGGDESSGDNKPIFIVIACPSSSKHTRNLANAIQQKLDAGRQLSNGNWARNPAQSFTFVNMLRKATYRNAANKINLLNNTDEETKLVIRTADEEIDNAANDLIIARNALVTIKKDRENIKKIALDVKFKVKKEAEKAVLATPAERAAIKAKEAKRLAFFDEKAKQEDADMALMEAEAVMAVTQAEAAMATANEQRAAYADRHVVFNPDLNVRIRHNELHELWNRLAAMPYDAKKYFNDLKPTPYWLIMAAKSAVTEPNKLIAAQWENRIRFALNVYAADIAPLEVDLVLEGLCNADNINEAHLEENGIAGNEAREFLSLMILDKSTISQDTKSDITEQLSILFSVVGTTPDSCSLLSQKAKDQWTGGGGFTGGASVAVLNAARAWDINKNGKSKIELATMIDTYSLPFNEWVAQKQRSLDNHIIQKAAMTPDSGFSISKISAQSGNRKHTEGFIIDNTEHDEQAAFDQLQAFNPGNRRPYILVIVDDNIETGTTMREVARATKVKFKAFNPPISFSKTIGVTALAIRGPTIRCAAIRQIPYTLAPQKNNS